MSKPLLDDALWQLIEPLLPKPRRRRRRHPGRKPLSPRRVLTGILFVLRTGIPWEYLPPEMGCGSGMSCWRYLRRWQRCGVWARVHRVLLAKLREADKIDWSRAVVDSTSVRAVFGGPRPVPVPWIAGKTARNTTCLPTPMACRWRLGLPRPIATMSRN